jgi:hypothetical protein
MHRNVICISLMVGVTVSSANAYEFRTRWVERIGSVDIEFTNGWIDAGDFRPHRVRFQVGFFDDANGPAPAGGLIGWSTGSLLVDARFPGEIEVRRTPGRLSPFNSVPGANGNPPLPDGDPFESLTDIDATLGPQSFVWGFDVNGQPLPQPVPLIRGFNHYTSIFEITLRIAVGADWTSIHAGGNLLSASEWNTVGTPIPPDPETQMPGSVTYAPVLLDPVKFTNTLIVYPGPTPGSASLLAAVGLANIRRRRR